MREREIEGSGVEENREKRRKGWEKRRGKRVREERDSKRKEGTNR